MILIVNNANEIQDLKIFNGIAINTMSIGGRPLLVLAILKS